MSKSKTIRFPDELADQVEASAAASGKDFSTEVSERLATTFSPAYGCVPAEEYARFVEIAAERRVPVMKLVCQLALQALIADAMLDEQDVHDVRREHDIATQQLQLKLLNHSFLLLATLAGNAGVSVEDIRAQAGEADKRATQALQAATDFERQVQDSRLAALGLSQEDVAALRAQQEQEAANG